MEKERLLEKPDGYLKILDQFDFDYIENPAEEIDVDDIDLWGEDYA